MPMKFIWVLAILFTLFCIGFSPVGALAKDAAMPHRMAAYDGKTFTGFQNPEYLSYDQALREYLVKRIDQRFGIILDPRKYSGFELLEIEALFKCKKSNEPFDMFLKMFPKRR